MRRLLASLLLAAAALAQGAWEPRAREHYALIIDKEPFGPMAAETAGGEAVPEATPEQVREESNKVQLCAMTVTPDGRTAVGIIDNGANPPAYITLFDGESSNGLELIVSDLDREFATFRRDGITFTLGLGLGLLETITPELLAQREAEAQELAAADEERKRKSANSLAAFTKEFDPNKARSEPQTETEALVQAGVEELKAAVAAGESPQDYLRRLVAHRQQEVQRQQAEKQAAQNALDQELAAGGLSESDAAYLRRRTNIELMKKGVVPLTPVNDLSDSERAEIEAALNASQP